MLVLHRYRDSRVGTFYFVSPCIGFEEQLIEFGVCIVRVYTEFRLEERSPFWLFNRMYQGPVVTCTESVMIGCCC